MKHASVLQLVAQCIARKHANPVQHALHSPAWIRNLSSSTSTGPTESSGPVADVAIVGSGMVGTALAALLAANPLTRSLRILLVDSQAQSFQWQPAPHPELRVSTITPATIACLQRAGACDMVQQHSAPFSIMQVWDSMGPGCIRWHAQDVGKASIGYVAENSLLQCSLLAALSSSSSTGTETLLHVMPSGQGLSSLRPGVTCLWPASLRELQLPPASPNYQKAGTHTSSTMGSSPDGTGRSSTTSTGNSLARLTFQDGTTLRARLVVAADGNSSKVRSLAHLRTFGWPYGQQGLVATVQLEGGGTDTAWQRFLPTGPLALLPVRDGYANIVWSTTPEMAKQLCQLDPEPFAAAVNQAIQTPPARETAAHTPGSTPSWLQRLLQQAQHIPGTAMSAATQALQSRDTYMPPPAVQAWVGSAPRSFPLKLLQAGRYVRPRLALIGDAAHAVHPLAGQGVNLGFGDAEVLADTLAHACEVGADPGDLILLQDRYERPRQSAVLSMTTALDGLQRVFSIQNAPLAAVRNLGMGMINAAGPVKNQIMKFAMGL